MKKLWGELLRGERIKAIFLNYRNKKIIVRLDKEMMKKLNHVELIYKMENYKYYSTDTTNKVFKQLIIEKCEQFKKELDEAYEKYWKGKTYYKKDNF